jgi:hypothetical protein
VLVLDPAQLDGDFEFTPDNPAPEPVIDTLGEEWRVHPRYVVGEGELETVRLWIHAGGLELRHLPEAGGVLDQAAIMLDAFTVISQAARKLIKKDGG